ncbi:MAG TPA: hypothetical protein PLG31_16915 [Spirochaetota bacterium]|nr:hypothetical protein [Spirochaetota bacterium]
MTPETLDAMLREGFVKREDDRNRIIAHFEELVQAQSLAEAVGIVRAVCAGPLRNRDARVALGAIVLLERLYKRLPEDRFLPDKGAVRDEALAALREKMADANKKISRTASETFDLLKTYFPPIRFDLW